MNWRRLRFGLLTVSGLARRGFFIPHRYAAAIAPRQPTYAALEAVLAHHHDAMADTLATINSFDEALTALDGPPPRPRWSQDWFPRADGAAAYALVRSRRPARIVEVGSGHSTRFMAQAVLDEGCDCAITAIDPAPRAAIDALPVRAVRTTVQQAGDDAFASLAAGDVLFIDSSHVLMPGTDVDVLFNRVLPRLPAGVLVHVHDVFLPDDYPEAWAWRGYNEQLAVAALLHGGGYVPLWASHYAATRMADAVAKSVLGRLPLPAGAYETSLWLEGVARRQPALGRRGQPPHLDAGRLLHRLCKIVRSLQPDPSLGATAKGLVEPDCHLGRNAGTPVDDVGQLLAADAEAFCRFGDAEFKRFQAIVAHGQAGMGRVLHRHCFDLLMVVNEIDVDRRHTPPGPAFKQLPYATMTEAADHLLSVTTRLSRCQPDYPAFAVPASMRPRIPSAINRIEAICRAPRRSPKTNQPISAVPAMPMPVHTA